MKKLLNNWTLGKIRFKMEDIEILSYRIKNYKSIKDSGEIYIKTPITIFAGMNESGKTNFLEAFYDINVEREINNLSKRINDDESEVNLILNIKIKDFNIIEEYDLDGDKIIFIKTKEGYEIENRTKLLNKKYLINRKVIEDNLKTIKNHFPSIKDNEIFKEIEKENNKTFYRNIENIEEKLISLKSVHNINIEYDFDKKVDINYILEKLKETVLNSKNFPNFIFFEEEDEIKDTYDLDSIGDNRFLNNLSNICDIDFEKIKNIDENNKIPRKTHKEELNITLEKDYKQYWKEGSAKLEIDWDKDDLSLYIKEGKNTFLPKQRSRGKNWFLSFYVLLCSRFDENKKNIILIDEPGQYLHPDAQLNLLNLLEDTSKKHNIIYSTHSPFLIDEKNLHRIKFIEKDEINNESSIKEINQISNEKTLSPIFSKLGMTQVKIETADNLIICEGISDIFYLRAFQKIFGVNNYNIKFVNGNGDDISKIFFILEGTSNNGVRILLDTDENKIKKKMKEFIKIQSNNILEISEEKNKIIEDLFEEKDFKRFVIGNKEVDLLSNRKEFFLKSNIGKSKALMSKIFLQKVDNGTLKKDNFNKTTIDNFQKILEKLK